MKLRQPRPSVRRRRCCDASFKAIRSILLSFGDFVKSTLAGASSAPHVDLAGEERVARCQLFLQAFEGLRAKLSALAERRATASASAGGAPLSAGTAASLAETRLAMEAWRSTLPLQVVGASARAAARAR